MGAASERHKALCMYQKPNGTRINISFSARTMLYGVECCVYLCQSLPLAPLSVFVTSIFILALLSFTFHTLQTSIILGFMLCMHPALPMCILN